MCLICEFTCIEMTVELILEQGEDETLDVFRFVMERENVDFPNAVHLLASRCGVIIPEKVTYDAGGKSGKERADERERLYRLSEDFAQFFEKILKITLVKTNKSGYSHTA